MKVQFTYLAEYGEAVYDTETGEYSWTYDGDHEDIIEWLAYLEDGRQFEKIVTGETVSEGDEPAVVTEWYELGDWEYQMEKLAQRLRQSGAKNVTVVE